MTALKLDAVRASDYNPRRITPRKYRALKQSIEQFGFVDPIIVNRRTKRLWNGNAQLGLVVVGGHQRLRVARELQMATVPSVVVELDGQQEQLLNVTLNNQAGEFDEVQLARILARLAESGVDVAATGFSDDQVARMARDLEVATAREANEDKAPAAPAVARTRPGELVLLGRHRLICGDATQAKLVARLMDGARAVVMPTDPPYLVGYDSKDRLGGGLKRDRASFSDAPDEALYDRFLPVAIEHALAPRAAIYQWHAETTRPLLDRAWAVNDVLFHQLIIWRKESPALGRRHYLNGHECAAYGWVRGSMPRLKPKATEQDVWSIAKDANSSEYAHPTQKPVELFRRSILNHTKEGDAVYEPFAGSGSCLVAAELSGRTCFAIEIQPAFCDVIRDRFEALGA